MMIVVIILFPFVGTLTFAAKPIQVKRIVRQIETAQLRAGNGPLQFFVLKLHHLATLGADLVMMCITIIALFVL